MLLSTLFNFEVTRHNIAIQPLQFINIYRVWINLRQNCYEIVFFVVCTL